MAVAQHCPQLTYLDLWYNPSRPLIWRPNDPFLRLCELITDAGIVAVAKHCPQLTHLKLWY